MQHQYIAVPLPETLPIMKTSNNDRVTNAWAMQDNRESLMAGGKYNAQEKYEQKEE